MTFSIGKGATLGFALAAAALVTAALVAHLNLGGIESNESLVVHTHAVLDELDGILLECVNGETSQRGFIITGDDAYLTPLNEAVPGVKKHFATLLELTSDNPAQNELAQNVIALVTERMDTLLRGVEARRSGGLEAGEGFITAGLGRSQMLRIRAALGDLETEERRLLAVRTAEMRQSHQSARLINLLTALLGLAMVGVAYYMTFQEIDTRRRGTEELEGKVRERTIELNETNLALRTSNRELEQFASVASHDLQEPLRKIEAFGDRLKTRTASLDESGRDYLERILVSASRMRTLINDLLSFSRVTTRAQPFAKVDLSRIAREVLSDLEARLQQVGGRVEIGDLPEIEADPTQVRQLLQNLIGNALKFHKPGVSPVVEVNTRVIPRTRKGSLLELTVKDNGIGFEEVYLDRIFEVFQRLHGRNEYEGTGIGLAICRKIAERHGGSITARSAPDQGAAFVVTLPISQTEEVENDV